MAPPKGLGFRICTVWEKWVSFGDLHHGVAAMKARRPVGQDAPVPRITGIVNGILPFIGVDGMYDPADGICRVCMAWLLGAKWKIFGF